jgi:threonine dehydrogenase-like Zn-dependent dehydrogenase
MKASVLSEYGKVVWKDVEKPVPADHEVLIRVHFASICGSDQHIFKGEFHPRTTTPMIMGHEFSGVIAEVGNSVRDFCPGERVVVDPIIWCGKCPACQKGQYPACSSLKLIGVDMNGGFAQFVAVPASMIYRIPDKVSLEHAALIELLSIGFHAKNRAGVSSGDSIAIWGSGKVGHGILEAVRTVTTGPVFMVDVCEGRLMEAARQYHGVVPVNALSVNPVDLIIQETGGDGVDIAFEAVGHATAVEGIPHPVRACVQSIRGGGTVCVLGLGDEAAPVVFKELIWKEGTIITSRVSHGEFSETISHLEKGDLKPDLMISDIFPGSRAMEAFEILNKRPGESLKILLDFMD